MKRNKSKLDGMSKTPFNIYIILILVVLTHIQCNDSDNNPEITDSSSVKITPDPGMDLYGFIGDSDGEPIENVVVSDGYNCVVTNEKGIYQMKKNANALFVFYSTPSDYAINIASETIKMAAFYAKIEDSERYDFELKKLNNLETDFTLVCIGDPQVTKAEEINRFKLETINDLKEFQATESTPYYGLVMGDIVGNKPGLFGQMKVILGSTDMPVFTTIGNHDKVEASIVNGIGTTTDFTSAFGPLNYSFNRGEVHFVCLDNVIFESPTSYSGGFSNNQIEWLKQDLSYVPKDKMIIVFYHIPLRGSASIVYKSDILQLLDGFAEVHLMSGHTHYNENYVHTSPLEAYEHVHGAACGSWWRSTLNGDGTPNGYAIYNINGATIKNWYYKPTNLNKDFQIRLHRGDAAFGGSYGYFSFNTGENTIIANIWNSDSEWKVEAFENGIKVADLTQLPTTLTDAWTIGYHLGVLNRNPDNYTTKCKHLYKHTLVDPNAILEIRATDRFGNVYTQNEIISDYVTAISY